MEYILTLWLLWAAGDATVLEVKPFPSESACASYAASFSKIVEADGVVASAWVCKLVEIEDA